MRCFFPYLLLYFSLGAGMMLAGCEQGARPRLVTSSPAVAAVQSSPRPGRLPRDEGDDDDIFRMQPPRLALPAASPAGAERSGQSAGRKAAEEAIAAGPLAAQPAVEPTAGEETPTAPDLAERATAVSDEGEDAAAKPEAPATAHERGGDEEEWPEYRIRTGDVITISIPYEPDSKRAVPVRPDGRITYLYDIEIMAAGRTYRELREDMKAELRRYYKEPAVTVIGESFAGHAVLVMGPVSHPGRHPIQNDTRLLDVLAAAGLLSLLPPAYAATDEPLVMREVVDLDGAYIFRPGRGALSIDFRRLLIDREINEQSNPVLKPGDFIFLPPAYGSAKKVYICGRVNRPHVCYYVGQLTFLEAILRAGGTDTDHYEGILRGRGSAQNRRCYILRKGAAAPIAADYAAIQMGKQSDIPLQPGDIVYVPERSLAYVSRITTQVLEEIVAPLQKVLDASDLSQQYYRRDWQLPSRGKARTR